VSNKTAEQMNQAIINRLIPMRDRVKTITFDNGKEFAHHGVIDQALGSKAYFADPFASWQRGNENLNGLVRQYIPEKRPLSNVTEKELKIIEHRLNHQPRKRLGFKTPHEVFYQSLNRVALRNGIRRETYSKLKQATSREKTRPPMQENSKLLSTEGE